MNDKIIDKNVFGIALKALVLFNSKVLIIKRDSNDNYKPNEYDLPGGRLEFGELPEEALVREILEETGLKVETLLPSRIWSIKKNENEQIIGITFLTISTSDKVKLSFEHQDFKWIDFNNYHKKDLPFWLKLELKSGLNLYNKIKKENE